MPQPPATIQNRVGKPVHGDNFFDREREQRSMWNRLETDNVLLLAPRRVGKTSLMWRLRDTAELHGFRASYCSVAGERDELGFVKNHPDTRRYHFRSPLLREFWVRRGYA